MPFGLYIPSDKSREQ